MVTARPGAASSMKASPPTMRAVSPSTSGVIDTISLR
jgi:hypothetical protein